MALISITDGGYRSRHTRCGVPEANRTGFGLEGDLHPDGPYQYSRNSQYVGMYATLPDVLLLVNSQLLIVGLLPVFVWMALLPFAEEPWLCETFGEEYDAYQRDVPRFLGRRTITSLCE